MDIMQKIHGTEVENLTYRTDEEGNLPVLKSVQYINLKEEDMAILCCIGITIDNNNDPAP